MFETLAILGQVDGAAANRCGIGTCRDNLFRCQLVVIRYTYNVVSPGQRFLPELRSACSSLHRPKKSYLIMIHSQFTSHQFGVISYGR